MAQFYRVGDAIIDFEQVRSVVPDPKDSVIVITYSDGSNESVKVEKLAETMAKIDDFVHNGFGYQ